MRFKKIILVVLMLSCPAIAEEKLDFFINKDPLTIYKYEESRISSSIKCSKLNRGEFCNELTFLKDLKNYKIKTKLAGGATAGSAVCNEKLNGIIVMARTSLGSENAFCKMKDDTYIELGTLGYYLNID